MASARLKVASKVAAKGYRVAALGDDKCRAKVRLLSDADREAFTAGECIVVAGMAADADRRHVVGAVCAVEHRANMLAKAAGFSIVTPNCDALAAKVHEQGAAKVGRVVASIDIDDARAYIKAALAADPKAKRTPTSVRYSREHLGRSADLTPGQWWPWCEAWADVTADPMARLCAEAKAAGVAYERPAMLAWAKADRPDLLAPITAANAARAKAAADAARARTAKAAAKVKAAAKAPKAVASAATKVPAKRASKPASKPAAKRASTRKPAARKGASKPVAKVA